MAAIDVHMFLENLKQLMSSGLDFVASQRDGLQIVYQYINKLSMLLKSAEEEGSTDQKENSVAMHVRDLVFEAENIVDQFIDDSVSSGGGCDFDLSTKLDGVKGKIEAIINICKHGKFELEWWYSKPADSTTHVVGLRPQIDKIMCRFKHGKSLEITSIVSLPGAGKITLAKQISNDHCTNENFEIQLWIKVCRGYGKCKDDDSSQSKVKGVLLHIERTWGALLQISRLCGLSIILDWIYLNSSQSCVE